MSQPACAARAWEFLSRGTTGPPRDPQRLSNWSLALMMRFRSPQLSQLRFAAVEFVDLSRSQPRIPLTVCGLGPRAPSVYCHIVQVFQFLGTTGVGPYCASQNQHSAKIGSVLVPSNCLM